MKKNNRGVALITVLLVLALITPIITYVALKQRVSVDRTASLDQSSKSIMYALAVETWARTVLIDDLKETEYDSLDEAWAKGLPTTLSDRFELTGEIIDLQSRLNINALIADKDSQFERIWLGLLLQLEIDPSKAQEIGQAIKDWLDADGDVSFPGGAEDVDYMSLESPYRTANQAISNVSELILVRGIDNDLLEKIRPFICALPETSLKTSQININTASIEILKAIFPPEADTMLRQYIDERQFSPYTAIEDFKQHYESEVGALKIEVEQQISVRTNYFLLNAVIKRGKQAVNIHSYFKRKETDVKVMNRYF